MRTLEEKRTARAISPAEKEDLSYLRVCRIASYPTHASPGTGLPGYYLSSETGAPTLFLTRKVEDALPVPDNTDLMMIDYDSPAFGEKPDLITAAAKIRGLVRFFAASTSQMRRFGPDIVHIHSPLYLMHAIWAKLFLRAKICMTFHGSDLLRIKRSPLLKLTISKTVDAVFHVSSTMREAIAGFLPERIIHYAPNGVDTERFRDVGLERKDQIVALGNLRWQKGYKYLVEAFSMLGERGYRLVIIGEGPLRKELQDQIDRLGLTARISLAGKKGYDEILRILNESRIYVMSSISEGFPKALLEGIATGLPAVTTDVGSCQEVTDGIGICVPAADAGALGEALEKMISDARLRERCASMARHKAEQYSWERSCRIVKEVYRTLLPPSSQGSRE
ncbi:MAG: glycosyltransferase family 4 protein [Candidatus Krumholzibacteriota bacterium]|nr:glycosyltransferase family 4 protein [Candidatus Krumholzibacteriota bacterium]